MLIAFNSFILLRFLNSFFLYTKTGANYCVRGEEQLISRTQLSFCGEVFDLCSEL